MMNDRTNHRMMNDRAADRANHRMMNDRAADWANHRMMNDWTCGVTVSVTAVIYDRDVHAGTVDVLDVVDHGDVVVGNGVVLDDNDMRYAWLGRNPAWVAPVRVRWCRRVRGCRIGWLRRGFGNGCCLG